MQSSDILLLAAGAFLGALLRYLITSQKLFIGMLPIGVLIVNIIGSFILGAFMLIVQLWGLDSKHVLFTAIGFCGSLTTMSSFAFETVNMIDSKQIMLAALNILTNVTLSIAAIILGRMTVSFIARGTPW